MADALRARITAGELRPGQRMPTQAKLADEFGVERGAVRQALRILQSEHLLTNVSKGAPATVAPDLGRALTGPGAPPQPTMVALAPRIAAAFAAPHVEIDALCLTSVSLTLAIGEPLRQIHAGQLKPAKVDVRVLLPSRDISLAFPTPVDASADDADEQLRRRWLIQRNAQGQVLQHNLLALRTTHGIDVQVSFRALPFTPPVKLYLLNSTEALFAYYTLARSEVEIDHQQLEMYDAPGLQSLLFAFEQGAGLRDTTFVEQSHVWFNALWETISSELVLTS
ncbi:winged helix-turn-helix domain-containing protein [Streptomyces regalis]|uniref:GntR family transcriptional regulator n=1 Tax=Streptomyces regalis TaxID=68262 RepID=A0A0X3V6Q8_9ACTN|nr:GntR family transcriptional regulator [Streptomyces regalis]